MGKIAEVKYLGTLRTENTHLKSGSAMLTDAPVDNNGKGEAFSPTDLLATSLANCMLTVMGIKARSEGFDLEEASASVWKTMLANPRRVGEVKVEISLKKNCGEKMQKMLEETARNCPVANSLHPDLVQSAQFYWID